VAGRRRDTNRIGFAVQLTLLRHHGCATSPIAGSPARRSPFHSGENRLLPLRPLSRGRRPMVAALFGPGIH
jgi:hypothetical protein